MKKDLIIGWILIVLALLMVFCIVVNCVNANWVDLSICGFVFGLNLMDAVNRFKDYKMHKKYKNQYSIMSMRCWSDYDEDDDKLKDTAETLSSSSFIDD